MTVLIAQLLIFGPTYGPERVPGGAFIPMPVTPVDIENELASYNLILRG
jgi:hypothetical protein